ncbi:MAG: GlcG/HbpS family heme-binding protein [Gammaproteobacteria bacterium]
MPLKKTIAAFLTASALALGSTATQAQDDDQPLMISIKRMSMETALTIAQATIEACRAEGVQIAVTVLDRSGTPQVVLRDVLAPHLTLDVSLDKAYTALSFNVATSGLGDRADSPLGRRDGLAMHAGGVPVTAAGELVGAVGVSGAPSGETDEKCAAAGVEAVATDLDMF